MAKRRPSRDGMVRRRDDGRWEERIVVGHKDNGDPIFHYVSANTQKALLEKLHKSIDEYDGAELTEQRRMTLGEWLDIWLKECAAPSLGLQRSKAIVVTQNKKSNRISVTSRSAK